MITPETSPVGSTVRVIQHFDEISTSPAVLDLRLNRRPELGELCIVEEWCEGESGRMCVGLEGFDPRTCFKPACFEPAAPGAGT